MSRAFTKEIDDRPEEIPARPVSTHPNFVTAAGLQQIELALARFDAAHTAAILKEDKTAIELTFRELRYWSRRKNSAILVGEVANTNQVQFGSNVTVRRHDGRVQSFRIVGMDEAEPSTGAVSYISPFAQSVIGKSVGDRVEISGEDSKIPAVG